MGSGPLEMSETRGLHLELSAGLPLFPVEWGKAGSPSLLAKITAFGDYPTERPLQSGLRA